MKRRGFLGSLGLLLAGFAGSRPAMAAEPYYPPVTPGRELAFPADHGAHPAFRVEWWYVTGWLRARRGFQVTFFRVRPEVPPEHPSGFAPRQVLLAHAALADPERGRLAHEERAARAGFGLAEAREGRTSVWIDDWRLEQEGDRYHARIAGEALDLSLDLQARELVLQGERGFSRKGHRPQEASYYYSRPHIAVRGKVNGEAEEGVAWLDHEWSSALLADEAAGWDWCGINLFDGGHFMAFRLRAKAGGTYFTSPGFSFEILRTWTSPRTGVEYPVSMIVAGHGRRLRLEPLMDDQELDARASTGTIYWEGAVRAFDASGEQGAEIGRGYLELTGYWRPMRL